MIKDNELNDRNALIRDAVALASKDTVAAIDMLETALATATAGSDRAAIAKHAAVICQSTGDLGKAAWFYGQSLAAEPNDAYAQLAAGQLYRELGLADDARKALLSALALVERTEEQELLGAIKREIALLGS